VSKRKPEKMGGQKTFTGGSGRRKTLENEHRGKKRCVLADPKEVTPSQQIVRKAVPNRAESRVRANAMRCAAEKIASAADEEQGLAGILGWCCSVVRGREKIGGLGSEGRVGFLGRRQLNCSKPREIWSANESRELAEVLRGANLAERGD